eukprot:2993482-Amphidinium_carterae.1
MQHLWMRVSLLPCGKHKCHEPLGHQYPAVSNASIWPQHRPNDACRPAPGSWPPPSSGTHAASTPCDVALHRLFSSVNTQLARCMQSIKDGAQMQGASLSHHHSGRTSRSLPHHTRRSNSTHVAAQHAQAPHDGNTCTQRSQPCYYTPT